MTILTTLSLNDMVTEALTNLEEIDFGRGSAMVNFGKKEFYIVMDIKKRRNYKNEIEKGFFLVSIEVEGVKIMDEITQYLSNTSATRIGIINSIENEMKFQNKN